MYQYVFTVDLFEDHFNFPPSTKLATKEEEKVTFSGWKVGLAPGGRWHSLSVCIKSMGGRFRVSQKQAHKRSIPHFCFS